MPIEKHRFPTDHVSQDSWISDQGPHHCEFCGYCVYTRTPEGELVPLFSQGSPKYFSHLPGRYWHVECAAKDDRPRQAERAIAEAVSRVFA